MCVRTVEMHALEVLEADLLVEFLHGLREGGGRTHVIAGSKHVTRVCAPA